jgi:hypothetical protein
MNKPKPSGGQKPIEQKGTKGTGTHPLKTEKIESKPKSSVAVKEPLPKTNALKPEPSKKETNATKLPQSTEKTRASDIKDKKAPADGESEYTFMEDLKSKVEGYY